MENPKEHLRSWATYLWIVASFQFALSYTLNTRPMLDLKLFEKGRESAPFQYRALTGWIMEFANHVIQIPIWLRFRLPPKMNSPEDFTTFAIALVSMLFAVYATRRALDALTGIRDANRWWCLLVIFMSYFHYLLEFGHPCCTPLQLPYDLPSMAFFAAGLWVIVIRRPLWLYPLVFLATLNRESTVFLIGIYFLYELGLRRKARQPLRSLFINASLLCTTCFLILLGLHHVFPFARPASNAMGPFENHVRDNLGFIVRPYYWLSYLSMFGFSWPYLFRNWRRIPHAGIRYAMAIAPIMFAAMYVVAVLSEIRIFGELISLFTIALSLLLSSELGLLANSKRLPHETPNHQKVTS